MTTWLFVIGGIYLSALVYASYVSWRRTKGADDYVLAGSNLGASLGLLTYAATLFSTFTLMGMPDFFRVHGVGAWIFLAVSDAAMVFLMVWFGYHLRRRAREKGYRGTAGLLHALYGTRWAGLIYFTGAFLFLVPYVAIQIRGLAIFLEAAFPGVLPAWAWSAGVILIMLVYSEIGGLRAIIYSDVLQGLTLLVVTWIIAVLCIASFGGTGAMFERVGSLNEALLSAPGPQGLFSHQFLLASLLAIVFLPVTQPQLTTRLIIMRDRRALNRMAVAIGFFAILIILPTVAIGMYGAVHYSTASTSEFLSGVLLFERSNVIGATVVVGLLAAAMSTADSQIFALGTELRSLLSGDEHRVLLWTKFAIGIFAFAALGFSIISGDELVLLARVSFAGTALMGPMILAGIFSRRPPGVEVLAASGLGLLVFLASLLNVVPAHVGPFRMDLLLLAVLGAITAGSLVLRRTTAGEAVEA